MAQNQFASMRPHQDIASQTAAEDMQFGLSSFHDDMNPEGDNPTKLSGYKVEHVLVRNGDVSALTKGQALTRDSDNSLTDVKACGVLGRICGYVPWWNASVPVGAAFLMVVDGPTTVKKVAGHIANLARVISAESGRVITDNTDVYVDEADGGFALEASDGAVDTGVRIMARCKGN